MEEKINDNTRLLEGFQADHQRLAVESKESVMIIQAAKQAIPVSYTHLTLPTIYSV